MKIHALFASLVISFTLSGCTHIEIVKAFNPTKLRINDSYTLSFSMEPTVDNTVDGVTTYGEPYKLMVLVPYQKDVSYLYLDNLVLVGRDGSQIEIKEVSKNLKDLNVPEGGSIVLSAVIESLKYQDYRLKGDFRVASNNNVELLNSSFSVDLDTDYKKKKINKFWSNLMGI